MKKTWQQWSVLCAFIIYLVALMGMDISKHNNPVFFSLLGVQAATVIWIVYVIRKWPN